MTPTNGRDEAAVTPAATDIADVVAYVRACREEVDDALERLLPSTTSAPRLATEAMRYSLFAGGKRLRPILTLAAADTVSPSGTLDARELVYPTACAIEMIHTYSLIHDDLPSMDDDTLRRGRPTSHVVYGEGMAILAGDALLTEAFRILAVYPDTDDATLLARKLRVAARTALAAGAAGMVGGQVIDLDASGQVSTRAGSQRAPLDADTLRAMHERKTGALIRAAAVAGAIMVGGTEAQIEAVDGYGGALGLGFQIVDDILDVEGGADALGKTVGKDAAAGKPTYPAMFGLDESRRLARSSIEQAKAALETGGLGGRLSGIADWVLARSH